MIKLSSKLLRAARRLTVTWILAALFFGNGASAMSGAAVQFSALSASQPRMMAAPALSLATAPTDHSESCEEYGSDSSDPDATLRATFTLRVEFTAERPHFVRLSASEVHLAAFLSPPERAQS